MLVNFYDGSDEIEPDETDTNTELVEAAETEPMPEDQEAHEEDVGHVEEFNTTL